MAVFQEIARTPSLAAKAKALLEAAIWSGQLAPGAHLVETQLAGQFQISRGPLREALKTLAAEGLVDIQPGRGAFVVDPTADDMQDMIVMRAVVSGMVARQMAANKDEALLGRLEVTLEEMRAAVAANDARTFFDQHWIFHEGMYRSANSALFRTWSAMHGLIDIYVRRLGRPHLALSRILLCYDCFMRLFRAGDPDEAEAAVRSQMLLVGFNILRRPIPPVFYGYITRDILDDGTVVPFDPRPAAQKTAGHRRGSK